MATNPAKDDAENIRHHEHSQDKKVPENLPIKEKEVVSGSRDVVDEKINEDGRDLSEIQKEAEEMRMERQKAKMEIESHKEDGTLSSAAAVQSQRKTKSFQEVEVEGVMQDGLEDHYKKMTPAQQQEFKIEGEKAASQIAELLKSAKVKAVKILDLIRGWLRLIPGVNKYFLEKESKIKTDTLIRMKKEGMFDNK